ncbi:DUF1348 family protein [Sphingomonas sp. NFR15]|uniref:DUF1348 family protein n=2 Tax=Sphingomonas TaxID=13687 RepID=UPI00210A5A15|nr:DUF1348 family protein [Sphingomonas sp. NFR15]
MARHVRDAENAWNRRDLDAIVFGNTIDCHWRDRVHFLWGREQIRAHAQRQVCREIDARVLLEGWAEGVGRLSLRFAREFRDDGGTWFRVYGSEDLQLDAAGLVTRRLTAANELPIAEYERALRWPAGARPDDHPTLSELGF